MANRFQFALPEPRPRDGWFRVGNLDKDKAPKYEDVIDRSFADKAIKELGEWKGPLCPSEQS